VESYERAINIDAGDAALYFNLGRAYAAKGQLQKGIEKMKEALEITPEFPEARAHLDALLQEEKEMLEKLLK